MAFLIHTIKDGHVPPWEYLPIGDGTYKVGDALVFVSGVLEKVTTDSGQDSDEGPHYIAMFDGTVATSGSTKYPVVKAGDPSIIWETTLSANDADIAAGLKYIIHTDGAQHSGTTTKGILEVLEFDGTTAGSKVRVRFAE
jgi:hypothetical protein